MKTLTIEIFIHKVYSRNGSFIEQYYEGILLGKENKEEKKLGEATGDTEQEVIKVLTNCIKYFPRWGECKIKVLD